jgi:hypothetical protein
VPRAVRGKEDQGLAGGDDVAVLEDPVGQQRSAVQADAGRAVKVLDPVLPVAPPVHPGKDPLHLAARGPRTIGPDVGAAALERNGFARARSGENLERGHGGRKLHRLADRMSLKENAGKR